MVFAACPLSFSTAALYSPTAALLNSTAASRPSSCGMTRLRVSPDSVPLIMFSVKSPANLRLTLSPLRTPVKDALSASVTFQALPLTPKNCIRPLRRPPCSVNCTNITPFFPEAR